MGTVIKREDWEGEVFDNLEEMCAAHPGAADRAHGPPDENPPKASEAELASGMRQMSGAAELGDDDDAWCPRLA